jgi:hypothetical protein
MTMTVDPDITTLARRLNNHTDANCDALAHFVEKHPDLEQEDRTTLLRALQANANKLLGLARQIEQTNVVSP